jgi:hypothetical protein
MKARRITLVVERFDDPRQFRAKPKILGSSRFVAENSDPDTRSSRPFPEWWDP